MVVGGLASVEAEIGLEIPELVARPHLKVDALQGVVAHQELAVSKHPDDQVDRSAITFDDLDGEVGDLGQLLF